MKRDHRTEGWVVPAGRHAIVWEYHDPAFERGRAVSLLAAALIALLFAGSALSGRRKRGAGDTAMAATAAAGG